MAPMPPPVLHPHATCGPVDLYRTRATCGTVGLTCASCGHARATHGPHDERHMLRRPRHRLPPPRELHPLGAYGPMLVDERGTLCRTRRRLPPACDDCTHGTRRIDILLCATGVPPSHHSP
jgi:hypothetical protein